MRLTSSCPYLHPTPTSPGIAPNKNYGMANERSYAPRPEASTFVVHHIFCDGDLFPSWELSRLSELGVESLYRFHAQMKKAAGQPPCSFSKLCCRGANYRLAPSAV